MASHNAQREFRKKYSIGAYKSEEEYVAHVNKVRNAIASKKYSGLKSDGKTVPSEEGKDIRDGR